MKWSALFSLMIIVGCGGRVPQVQPAPEIIMDPVVIRKPDPKRSLDFYDAKEVFDRARLARAFKKYRECVQLFTIVVVEFPNSKYAFPAFYNRGLCHESLDDPHAASLDFEAFIRKSTQSADRLDGQFRLLHNLVEISHDTRALLLVEHLLTVQLDDLDQAEVLTKKAKILHRLGQVHESKPLLRKAIRLAKSGTDGMVYGNSVLAESELLFGDLLMTEMKAVLLQLPLSKMQTDLSKKLSLFRKSQLHYLNAVRTQVQVYSATAGEHLGQLYANLYSDLLSAERPDDLSPLEIKVYLEELLTRVTPVLRNAIKIYEKSIALGQRLGETDAWLENINEQKNKLENLLREVETSPPSTAHSSHEH